jgi:ABC-type transporter Mla maintaining outer membrane lipid asymmetry ATPase subunit MlaF
LKVNPYIKAVDLVAHARDQSLIGMNSPIHFEILPGRVGGILGAPYGLSLFQLILGLGKIEKGSLELFGAPLCHDERREDITWRQLIGFSGARKGLLSNLSLIDNVNLPAKYHGYYRQEDNQEHLAQEQLKSLEVPEKYWRLRPHQVSGAVVKRTLLARSVVLNPKILLLESPFEYFGWQELGLLTNWLEKQKASQRAILIASDHIPFLTMSCDWLIDHEKGEMNKNFKETLKPSLVAMAKLMKESGERNETLSH